MKFLVPNYSCFQPPPDPHSLCPQLNLLNPPPNKIPGYATATMPAENNENKVELAERVENGSECAGFKLNIKKNREISIGGTSENL